MKQASQPVEQNDTSIADMVDTVMTSIDTKPDETTSRWSDIKEVEITGLDSDDDEDMDDLRAKGYETDTESTGMSSNNDASSSGSDTDAEIDRKFPTFQSPLRQGPRSSCIPRAPKKKRPAQRRRERQASPDLTVEATGYPRLASPLRQEGELGFANTLPPVPACSPTSITEVAEQEHIRALVPAAIEQAERHDAVTKAGAKRSRAAAALVAPATPSRPTNRSRIAEDRQRQRAPVELSEQVCRGLWGPRNDAERAQLQKELTEEYNNILATKSALWEFDFAAGEPMSDTDNNWEWTRVDNDHLDESDSGIDAASSSSPSFDDNTEHDSDSASSSRSFSM